MSRRHLRVSASGLKTFRSCPARWAFRKLDGHEEPGTPATERGKSVHREMELYGKLGILPTSKMALALVEYAPPPGVAECEVPVMYETPSSRWLGYIDAVCDWVNSSYQPLGTNDRVILIDYKSTSNLKYAMTPDELRDDVAANIYAWEAYLGGAKWVWGKWLYVDGRGRVEPVGFSLPLSSVTEKMIQLDGEAAVMQAWSASGASANDLPKRPSACWAYHSRCPHYERCMPATTFSMEDAK